MGEYMNELISEYIKYLSSLKEIVRPKMPKIDLSAYTDNEYTSAIEQINLAFDGVNDFETTINFLKNNF